jgi:hypothetical protein
MIHQANGAAHADDQGQQQEGNGFPYGIDPRDFGLSQYEYQKQLEHHRQMEHYNIMNEKHEDWRIEQQRKIEDARYHEARNKDREWWLEPLNAFFSCAGFCFWIVMWGYCIISVLASLAAWSAKTDAQWCLKDIAKCEQTAGPDFKVPGKEDRK